MIKTTADLDKWRNENKEKDGSIMSRYQALKQLFGERQADKIMRNLEVQSWTFLEKLK